MRAPNLLQFYTTPLVVGVLGENGAKEFNDAFNTFKIEDTVLTSGKRGTKIIEMFPNREKMPNRGDLTMRAKMRQKETGKRVEIVAINPEYLRNFEFDIKLIPNPRIPQSKAVEKALLLEKARVYMEFMPELIDKEQLAAQIAEAFGDRPERVLKLGEQQQPQQEGQFPGAGDLGAGANLINAVKGGAVAGLRSLSKEGA